MKIRSVSLQNVMSHDSSALELPARGIVTLSGLNGAGKSSLIEAVASVWGRTLRGTPIWRAGDAGTCEVRTSELEVQRRATAKGGGGLRWKAVGEADWRKFDTSAKANAELLRTLPLSFDQWRRSHVFSGADLAGFSRLGDVERKKLLDSFLGLDAVEGGIKACREQQATARRALDAAQTAVQLARQAVDQWAQAPIEPQPAPLEPQPRPVSPFEKGVSPPTLEDVQAAERAYDTATHESIKLLQVWPDDTLAEARIAAAQAAAGEEVAAQRLAAVEYGLCGECGRTYDSADVQAARDGCVAASTRFREAKQALDDALAAAQQFATQHRANIDAARAKAAEALAVSRKMSADLSGHAAYQERVAQWEEAETRAEAAHSERVAQWAERQAARGRAVSEAEDRLLDTEGAAMQAKVGLAELVVSDAVMGAVRTAMVGGALSGLEEVANAWLEFFQSPIRVKLHAGIASDRIGFELTGAGGGHGYEASSSGERRRVDAALLLAMVEIVSASTGVIGGTLWFDELFDTLDSEVVPYVCQALEHLAQARCVVVVTHRTDLLRNLSAAARFVVQGGSLHPADADGLALC
jgi:DNA repair exonuclease SbcCD ATPase subunit